MELAHSSKHEREVLKTRSFEMCEFLDIISTRDTVSSLVCAMIKRFFK